MPIVNIPEKVCSHCNGTVWYARKVFRRKTSSEGYRYVCNLKKIEAVTTWRQKNPEQYVKALERGRLNRRNQTNCMYYKKNVEFLSDRYLVSTIIGAARARGILYKKDIPQELIDMKRTQLLLKRQIV